MEGQPGQVLGGQVEDEHDRSVLDCVREAQQLTGDPHLFERPADVGLAEAHPLRRHLGHLHEMPDRRRTLHRTIVAAGRPPRTYGQPKGHIDDRLRELLDYLLRSR